MNKVITIFCLGAILIFSGCKRETKDERFKRECEQFTQKECPMEMYPGVNLDSLCYDTDNRIRSEYYTVEADFGSDSIFSKETLATLHDALLKDVKSSIQLKPYKDEGITFRYVYISSSSKQTIFEMSFTPKDYGN